MVKRVDSVEEINDWQQFLTFRCRAEVEAILARSKKTLKQTKRDQYVIAQGTRAGMLSSPLTDTLTHTSPPRGHVVY